MKYSTTRQGSDGGSCQIDASSTNALGAPLPAYHHIVRLGSTLPSTLPSPLPAYYHIVRLHYSVLLLVVLPVSRHFFVRKVSRNSQTTKSLEIMTFQGILLFLLFLDTFHIQGDLSFPLFPDTSTEPSAR